MKIHHSGPSVGFFDDRYVNKTGDTMTGDLNLQDDVFLHLGTDSNRSVSYNSDADVIYLPSISGNTFTDVGSEESLYIYSNVASDGSGMYEPAISMLATGVMLVTNTTQGDAGNRYLSLRFTDGVRIRTTGAGKDAILNAGSIATSDKTFQFPNASGEFAILSDVTNGQSILTNNGATDAITVLDSGNVGIGTTGPSAQLEMQGADARMDMYRFSSTGAIYAPGTIFYRARGTQGSPATIETNDMLGKTQFAGYTGASFVTYGYFSMTASDTSQNGYFTFQDKDQNDLMVIETGGDVGVGISPMARLQVYDALAAPDDLGDFDNYQLVVQGHTDTGDTAGILLSTSSNTYGGSGIVHFDTGSGGKGDLVFYTKQSTSAIAPVEVMRLDDAGNVGIGTTGPGAKLDVGGYGSPDVLGEAVALFKGDVDGIGGIEMYNANQGSSAEFRFLVMDNEQEHYLAFTVPDNTSGGAIFGLTRNTASYIFTHTNGAADTARHMALGTIQDKDLIFGTNNTERVRIDSNGNVGIGTTSPGGKLEIAGSGDIFRFTTGYAGTGEIPAGGVLETRGSNFALLAGGGSPTGNKFVIDYHNGSSWYSALEVANVASGYGNLLLMKSGGNVGIGVTDPDTKLEVFGSTGLKISFDATDNTTLVTDTSGDLTVTPSGTKTTFTGYIKATKDCYAEMFIYNNSNKAVMYEADTWHGAIGFAEGNISDCLTFHGAVTQAITIWADAGAQDPNEVTATSDGCQAAGLAVGDFVTINNTTNYNGVYEVKAVTTNTFNIVHADSGNDGTGQFTMPAHFHVENGDGAGLYSVTGNGSISPDANSKEFDLCFFVNGDAQTNTFMRCEAKTSGTYNSVAFDSLVELANGDVLWLGIMGLTDATDVTVKHANLAITLVH